ncbi:hypothetical protein [Anabaena sp. UHCC 0451]|uniref:hypothetical protein n=1 Tax=Anabaena sp. UHCC 0451 TaxID=2055235 RepID=UPI002B1F96FB|nr:hypothetical protein [Anabaena sp. UHCC 0451]MEA5577356.1 hypothetical protein [Anabaena sp. UHCC 0451]
MDKVAKCPLCRTDLINSQQQLIAQNHINKLKEIEKKNKELTDINQQQCLKIEELNLTIQELQIKLKAYENTEKSGDQYNLIADNEEIRELIDKLKHPLVIEVIKSIINDNQHQQINHVNSTNQEAVVINEVEEVVQDEDLDDTANSEIEPKSQEENKPALILTPMELKLVNQYKNHDPNFRESIIKVSESMETQENRRSGRKTNTIFQKDNLGNYWIYPSEDSCYIFPPEKLTINDYNKETVESVFECNDYSHTQSKNTILIKPGKVNSISADKWEVLERGILEFQ